MSGSRAASRMEVAGLAIGIAAIVFGLLPFLLDKWEEREHEIDRSSHITNADRLCGEYLNRLSQFAHTNPSDLKGSAHQYEDTQPLWTEMIDRWEQLDAPEDDRGDIQAIISHMRSWLSDRNRIPGWLYAGDSDTANMVIANANKYSAEARTGAQSFGYKICPGPPG